MTLATGTRRAAGEGTVGLDASDRIARLRGETFAVETSSADYAGIALVAPALRRRLPRPGCLVGDVLIANGREVPFATLASIKGPAAGCTQVVR
jgi:hypothetical protein